GRLSPAQQQLVEIAKALSRDVRLLIMDEPTASLTGVETERLLTLISDLRSRGVSAVYISHRLREIERIADRVVALRDGKNAGALDHGAIDHDSMVRLMVGRDLGDSSASRQASKGAVCLEVQNLRTRRYPAHDVSLFVRHGEILGLAGLAGAGRTDLMHALF